MLQSAHIAKCTFLQSSHVAKCTWCKVQVLQNAGVTKCTYYKVHMLQRARNLSTIDLKICCNLYLRYL